MIGFERILFPVDLSDESRRAAPFVKAMARSLHSDVAMLYVFESPVRFYGPPEGVALVSFPDIDRLREERRAEFAEFLAEEFAGVTLFREMAEGDPPSQIDCYARTKKVDLIMMPTHGYGVFRRLLLGSVTAKVLHDAQCPVWTGVHSDKLISHDPERCRRIVCAVDTNPKDAHVIKWAAGFARQRGAELHLIHAVSGAEGSAAADAPFREFLFKVAREGMQKLLADAEVDTRITLCGGKPERVATEAAMDWEADLLVIGRGMDHALGRLHSTAYGIIRESPCPVISV